MSGTRTERARSRADDESTAEAASSFASFLKTWLLWLAITLPVAVLLGFTSVESLFIPAFLGLLILALVFEPVHADPWWWKVTRWTSRSGFVVLGYFVVQRANELGIQILG